MAATSNSYLRRPITRSRCISSVPATTVVPDSASVLTRKAASSCASRCSVVSFLSWSALNIGSMVISMTSSRWSARETSPSLLEAEPGSQPAGANSNASNTNPGATVQPTSVHSPRLSADCQWPAGMTACGRSPVERSVPRRSVSAGPGAVGAAEKQRRAGVKMPELGRVDAVPGGALARLQQVVDGGGEGAAVRAGRVAERLAEMAALGVRHKSEQPNDLVGRYVAYRSEPVFSRADFGEYLRRIGPRHAEAFGERRVVGAQERIGRLLAADRRRQRRLMRRAEFLDFAHALAQGGVAGVDRHGEARVGQCIFVAAMEARVVRQRAHALDESHIIACVPSMTRPQPSENTVSPTKTSVSPGSQ